MTLRQSIYLALSALGISFTWYHNLAFAKESGAMDIGAFVSAVFVNHASASIGWDITIGCTAFLVFLFAGDQVGTKAVAYPRRPVRWLTAVARTPWPRIAGGAIGVLGLAGIVVEVANRGSSLDLVGPR